MTKDEMLRNAVYALGAVAQRLPKSERADAWEMVLKAVAVDIAATYNNEVMTPEFVQTFEWARIVVHNCAVKHGSDPGPVMTTTTPGEA